MKTLLRTIDPPSPCGYRPDQLWSLEHLHVARLGPEEYQEGLLRGWRRFGNVLFRPRCPACSACRSLRVDVARFRPDRSQRRVCRANEGAVRLEIGPPSLTPSKLDLYDRYHRHQALAKDWPPRAPRSVAEYRDTFLDNPFPTQEWCYRLGDRLIGVGYVDDLPGGLSAIYFFYDPDERRRSPGTWNVLSLIAQAAARGLPHVYLGYYVADCPSLAYKARFVPNQVLGTSGRWEDFRS